MTWNAEKEAEFAKFCQEIEDYGKASPTPTPSNVVPLFPVPPAVAPAPINPLPLTFFDQCRETPRKNWILKGVLAEGEDSSWYGAPGSTKSMLLTDIAVHVAAGRDWRGRKNKKQCGVVYFALERADLTRRRLAAYAVRDHVENLPIAVCDSAFNILAPDGVTAIVATVKAAEEKFGCPVGLIIFDTWAKLLGAAGGDEDKAQWVNAVAVALGGVRKATGSAVHIASVGHSGKDTERGERGSNAKVGHVDMAVQVAGADVKTATITKGNDVPEGDLTSYRVESIPLGLDEDGEPVTAGIISRAIVSAEPKTRHRVTEKQEIALNLLDRLVADQGRIPAPDLGLPPVVMIKLDAWRDALFQAGILKRDSANPRTDFSRLRDSLAAQIEERDGFIWPVRTASNLPNFPRSGV